MAALSKWVPVGMASDQPQFNHLKLTTIDKIGGIYCRICHTKFGNKKEYDTHYLKHDTGSKDITYTCVVCYKDIVGYPSFRGHCYTIHVMKDKFRCTHCNKQFSKQTALVSHYESLHQFKCSTCHVRFQSQKDLAMHQICHKNEQCNPPYNCQICNKQIEDTNDCEQHIEDHCSISYFCPICDEGINEIHNATSHLAKHFGDVLIEDDESNSDFEGQEFSNDSSIDILGGIFCSICKKTYKARPDFDNHFMLEHDDKKIIYGCNICAKEYDKYFVFANHCYNHYTKDKFQCEVCFKSFPRLSLLVIHMEAHSRTRDGGFQCLQCGHELQTARRLRDHYKTEHDICYSQCPEEGCGKIFATPKELVLHRKEHAGGNWCQQCGLRFASLAACLKHVPVHRKKRYSCPVCKRCYGEKYLLMKHVTQHFSAVLHVCKICGKVYSHRHRLMQHMKVHNEAKEHACAICGKGFAKLYLLKQHQNIHFNTKPYKCSNCPKTFASVPNLRKHMKKIHNVTQITFNHYEKPAETSNEKLDVSNPSSSEMSVDAPTSLEESDESCGWRADDTLDELMTLEELDPLETRAEEISEIEADLWVPSPMMPTATPVPLPASVPCEYGPELVPLDEHCLPHAPPQLVTQPRWPPVLTKLADCAYADLAYADLAEVMNADIY